MASRYSEASGGGCALLSIQIDNDYAPGTALRRMKLLAIRRVDLDARLHCFLDETC